MEEKKTVEKREEVEKTNYQKPGLTELGSIKTLTGSGPADPPIW